MDNLQELRERNEYLEETVASLRQQLGQDADERFIGRCRDVFGIKPAEAKLLRALTKAHTASRDALLTAVYSGGLDEPEIGIINTLVCKMRPKLERQGVRIETIWGQGYALSPADKARIEQLLS